METTTLLKFPRPVEGDCALYYFKYINQVPDEDILDLLEQQSAHLASFIQSLTPEQLLFRYAPGKWSIAEMLGHLFDAERVFAYRMMCISRGEQKSLPGFEQDDYVAGANFDAVSGGEFYTEWNAIRTSTISLCRNMTAEMAARMGTANNIAVKASAFAFIIAGHVNHHMNIVVEKYFPAS